MIFCSVGSADGLPSLTFCHQPASWICAAGSSASLELIVSVPFTCPPLCAMNLMLKSTLAPGAMFSGSVGGLTSDQLLVSLSTSDEIVRVEAPVLRMCSFDTSCTMFGGG